MLVACVLKSGGIYDATWVARLKAGVAKHLTIPHRFVCLSDVDVPCERIPLVDGWPGWWSKIELLKMPGPCLYFDLDTIPVGSLDHIAQFVQSDRCHFVTLQDFYRPDGLGSGMMAWGSSDQPAADFYGLFVRDPQGWQHKVGGRGDQGFLEEVADLSSVQRWQTLFPGQVVSYKAQYCERGIPSGARVICLHGKPKFSDMPAGDAVRVAWELAA